VERWEKGLRWKAALYFSCAVKKSRQAASSVFDNSGGISRFFKSNPIRAQFSLCYVESIIDMISQADDGLVDFNVLFLVVEA
jgi:hypothetical protein